MHLLETPQFYLIAVLLTAFIFLFDLGVNVTIRELFQTELDKMMKFKQYLSYFIHSHHLRDHRTSKKNLILREVEKL